MSKTAECSCTPFTMRVAGLYVRVHPLHAQVGALCRDYTVAEVDSSSPVDLDIRITQGAIDAERAMATEGNDWSDAYLETLAVLRAIANELPARRRMLVHGAALEYDGRCYLFMAPSGTGKSTHLRLWRQCLGDAARVVNGDKPFLCIPQASQEAPLVYGTPWAGKEGWQCNTSAPLAGIVLLFRSEPGASRIHRVQAASCIDRIVRQMYVPASPMAAADSLDLFDAVLQRVPVFELACDISTGAVRVSFEALTGRPMPQDATGQTKR